MLRIAVSAVLLLGSLAASADEMILIPLGTGVAHGALGTRWETAGYVRNSGPEPVCITAGAVPTCIGPEEIRELPGAPALLTFEGPTEFLRFTMIVRETSREAQTWGAEIPIIRERDLVRDYMELIVVPTAPEFRRNLRLYANAATPTMSLTVRVWDADADLSGGIPRLLGTKIYTFKKEDLLRSFGDLDAEFPEMRTTGHVRIEIERTGGDGLFWAFVTLTSNTTNHVTTIQAY
jgi:hypothetical protein